MDIVAKEPNTTGRVRRVFGTGRRLWLSLLVGVIAACVAGLWMTKDSLGDLSFLKANHGGALGAPKTLVDLTPWLTAQALMPLAISSEEKEDAREAEHLADHEVDQTFASALRMAGAQKGTLTPEAKALTARVAELEALVKEDQARVTSLTPAVAATTKNAKSAGGGAAVTAAVESDDLEVAKAQLGLDSDELNDAQDDLARAVGDERGRIQQELTAHEAVMKKYDSQAADMGELAVISTKRNSSLAHKISAWFGQRSRKNLILQAAQDAQNEAARLTAKRAELEAKASLPIAQDSPVDGQSPAAARLAAIKAKATQRQVLTIYNDRIQTEQQLSRVYAKWAAQVVLQHRIVLFLIVQSVGWIAFILLCLVILDMMIGYWTARPGLDQRRQHTLRTILRVSVQVVGLVLILVVIFGKPSQIPTIIGLATAGLTVALQSYILAFCGWFVLMGKNGMRIGDSVEINGVGGEVAEIGLFRTMLLETGNWTAKGHPTGRLVAFMNTFAVTGQYFNFSTVGQWMWDEITVSVSAREDMYPTIETIHDAVAKETEADVASAEAEWKGSSRGSGLSQFSAVPTVNLRPAASGVDVVVRYITRAACRFETRNKLYQAVLDVLGKRQEAAPEPPKA